MKKGIINKLICKYKSLSFEDRTIFMTKFSIGWNVILGVGKFILAIFSGLYFVVAGIINIIISANASYIALIPSEYRYPEATGFIVRAFELGRASTLPEAYDKLEEQLHRWKMEESMKSLIDMQTTQLEFLRNISQNTDWF